MSSLDGKQLCFVDKYRSLTKLLLSVDVFKHHIDQETIKIQKKSAFRAAIDISLDTVEIRENIKRNNQNAELEEIGFDFSKNGQGKQIKVLYPKSFPETLLCVGTLKIKPQHTDYDYKEALQLDDLAGNIDRYFKEIRKSSYPGEPKTYMSVLLGNSCKECTVQRVIQKYTTEDSDCLSPLKLDDCYHKMFFVALHDGSVKIKPVRGRDQLAVVKELLSITCIMLVPNVCIIPCPSKQFKYGLNPECIYMVEPSLEASIETFIDSQSENSFVDFLDSQPDAKRRCKEIEKK